MATAEQLYKFHSENLREVKRAARAVERPLKLAIRERDERAEGAMTKLYALLVAARIECRLQKLLYEPHGFSESQRETILETDSQLDRWLYAVEVAFRFQYEVQKVTEASVGFAAWSQYTAFKELIGTELKPIIELRNKLAHGQWVYTLNNAGTEVAADQMVELKALTFTNIRLKSALAEYICDAVHELVVARNARTRNFDQHYERVLGVRRNLAREDHEAWSRKLQSMHEEGKRRRRVSGRESNPSAIGVWWCKQSRLNVPVPTGLPRPTGTMSRRLRLRPRRGRIGGRPASPSAAGPELDLLTSTTPVRNLFRLPAPEVAGGPDMRVATRRRSAGIRRTPPDRRPKQRSQLPRDRS
jgi:hypothetical protein